MEERSMRKKPVVLMVLDGYGLNDKVEGNAVAQANTPVMDSLMKEYPFVHGNASGMAVGLPEGQMGNSEVGHMNMGAGRIVYQELTRITKEIQDGDFFKNEALLKAIDNCKKNNSALHLMGLLSDGGVHSHITHLYGLLELAKQQGLEKVYVHCFLDGRDTPPASGKSYAEQLNEEMKKIGVGRIASVMGRYYAMDRDNNYDRVQLAYDAMTEGKGLTAACGICGIQESYDREETDEFVKPTVVVEDGKAVGLVQDKDSVIFFNFRPDRAREITRAFCDDDFKGFDRVRKDITFVCFSDYDPTIPNKEVSQEYVNAISTMNWHGVIDSVESSRKLLESLWAMDADAVAAGVDKAHDEISILQYNDENSLSCTINLAFYFAREYYTIIRELPTGKGFADICLIPRKLHLDKPAVVIELKWDKSASGALDQIREKQYGNALKDYHGSILLVGINYNKTTKKHECMIETMQK